MLQYNQTEGNEPHDKDDEKKEVLKMRFTLLNDSMCYKDAYLMASRAVNLCKAHADHGYKARKWEYLATPGIRNEVTAYYAITRMDKVNYSELVGILWL